MIVFPPSTRLNPPIRVPKERVYLGHTGDVTRLKRLFTAEVEKIVWSNKLSPRSLNLPSEGSVREIEVIETTLKTQAVNAAIYREIDVWVKPHHVLHLITTTDHFEAVFGYWTPGEKAARYYAKSWGSRDEAELAVRGATMDAVYVSLMEQLGGTRQTRRGVADAKSWRERDARHAQLARQIAQLKALRRNERQMNRQFELAQEIRRLERELSAVE